jgi:voltage-gated potassium channel Kch
MSFRRSLARFVSDYRWYILALGATVAFILGCIGWWKFYSHGYVPPPTPQPNATRPDITDAAYGSLQDFIFNTPAQPDLPWELDVARFLAPAVAGWAGLSALGLLFRDRVQQMKIPLMRGHVVICGLGGYVGSVFVRHLHQKRIPVVVIEIDPANSGIELCRSLGIPVIVGDAQRQRTLQAAGAHRAHTVLAITPNDAVNTQIVTTVRGFPRRGSHKLRCLALIANPEFCRLLRIQEARRGDPELSVDFINIDENSARLLLEDFPLDIDQGHPHIVVAHLDPLGVWLVYHAARAWYDKRKGRENSDDPLVVTVLDHQPKERIEALLGRHPPLEQVCKLVPLAATARDIGRLQQLHRDRAISRVYVTAYDDAQAFETALHLRHELDPDVPVVAALSRPHGVAGLLDDVREAGALSNIEVFSTMERTCTAELVQGGSFEPMAHAIHERWRQGALARGERAETWEELDESRRESSRDQARHIPAHLRLVECAIAPLRDWDAKEFTFSDAEVTLLASAEHERWNSERKADGWTLAAERNPARKQTPYLIPWEDLTRLYPDIAKFDSMFVKAIPAILATVGLQVIRTPSSLPPAGTGVS